MSTPHPDDATPYRDAIAELETILEAIERDDVDLDVLAEKVARAAELIQLCRARIERTELQVKSIIDALDEPRAET